MNILFLFCSLPNLSDDSTLFSSLINEFKRKGHKVFVSAKGRNVSRTELVEENGIPVIRIQSQDFTGVNSNVKKALGYIEYSVKQVHYTKKLLKGQQIDMIISHSLPPELGFIASRLKRHFKCPFYLIHSDFTWQDAVVYGYFGKNSPIGLYYRYWERKMFKVSDYICVPIEGTIKYIRDQYPFIPESRFRVCQFWQKPLEIEKSDEVRKKLGLEGKFVVIYGGSVGQAQRVDHMVNLAESVKDYEDIVFLLLGKGAKLGEIKQMVEDKKLKNFRFLDFMPQKEYLQLLSSCDAGLIILNEVHGSPNFPSKTASYFNLQVPVLAAIDKVTSCGYGPFLDETQTGLWSISGDEETFKANLLKMYNNPDLCAKMKENELKYFNEKMTTEYACKVMSEHINPQMGGGNSLY